MDKPLICGKTAKSYKFWDNLMYHYKTLYPLYDKKVDFAQYTRWEETIASWPVSPINDYMWSKTNCPSVHDGWLFSNPKNLKLHNKVCKFEQVQSLQVSTDITPKDHK